MKRYAIAAPRSAMFFKNETCSFIFAIGSISLQNACIVGVTTRRKRTIKSIAIGTYIHKRTPNPPSKIMTPLTITDVFGIGTPFDAA